MADRWALEVLFRERGYEDFVWIDAESIVVAHWVRMKCRYGCDGYGRHLTCPPNVPSVAECRGPRARARPPRLWPVDVFSTVRKHGLPIEVLSEYDQPMNRYAFLLIE